MSTASGNPFRSVPFKYNAPPLVNASLAFAVIFLVTALIQLGAITFSVVRRKGSRLIAPVIVTALALIVSTIGYSLIITSIVVLYTDNRFGFANITWAGWSKLQVATTLFEEWPEFCLLATVVLFIRDRYMDYAGRYAAVRRSYTIPIMAILALFTVLLVILPVIFNMMWFHEHSTQFVTRELSDFKPETGYLNTYYVYVGTYVVASVFVCALSWLTRRVTAADAVSKVISTVVVPLLALRAVARVVFTVVNAVPPENANTLAITFFNWLVLYGLYLAITSVLVFCLVRPQLWNKSRETIMLEDTRLQGAAASDANFDAQWPQRFTSDAASDMKFPPNDL